MSDSKRRIPDAMAVADCDDLRRSYSDLPIGSSVHWATHPDAMASTARLFGLKPAPLQHCRVLELGCACGGNVVPIANGLPESRCVGIDISDVQIQKAQRLAEQLGVTNVELRAANIFDLNSEIGEFDYVICDGVFSWVPEAVQERILQICAQCLSENGIAYLSFNAYPGWHVRGTVREMLRFQTRNCTSDRDKISAARRLLLQLKESVAREDSPLNHLREEIELLRNSRDSYLFHEHLVEHNTPFYLTDFVECASSHALQFFTDLPIRGIEQLQQPGSSPQIGAELEDRVQSQQLADFLENRSYHCVLLCRSSRTPSRHPSPDAVRSLLVGSSFRPQNTTPDFCSTKPEEFVSGAESMTSGHPFVKAALTCLSRRWPMTVTFSELWDMVRAASVGTGAVSVRRRH